MILISRRYFRSYKADHKFKEKLLESLLLHSLFSFDFSFIKEWILETLNILCVYFTFFCIWVMIQHILITSYIRKNGYKTLRYLQHPWGIKNKKNQTKKPWNKQKHTFFQKGVKEKALEEIQEELINSICHRVLQYSHYKISFWKFNANFESLIYWNECKLS